MSHDHTGHGTQSILLLSCSNVNTHAHTRLPVALLIRQVPADILLSRCLESSRSFNPTLDFSLKPYFPTRAAITDTSSANLTNCFVVLPVPQQQQWECRTCSQDLIWTSQDKLTIRQKSEISRHVGSGALIDSWRELFTLLKASRQTSLWHQHERLLSTNAPLFFQQVEKYNKAHWNTNTHLRRTRSCSSQQHSCAALTQSQVSRKGLNVASAALPAALPNTSKPLWVRWVLVTAGPHGGYLGPRPRGDDRISFGQKLPYPQAAHDNMMDEREDRPEERAGTQRPFLYLQRLAVHDGPRSRLPTHVLINMSCVGSLK